MKESVFGGGAAYQMEDREAREWRLMVERIESYDEAVSLAIEVCGTQSSTHWQLGDLAARVLALDDKSDAGIVPPATLAGEAEEIDRAARTLRAYASAIRVGYGKLKEAVRVARAVEPGVRGTFPRLYFSHWRALVRAGVEGPGLIDWARTADDGSWSAERLGEELREATKRGDAGAPDEQPKWQQVEHELNSQAIKMRRITEDEKALMRTMKEAPEVVREWASTARQTLDILERLWGELREAGERVSVVSGPARRAKP
jgi:hypothetical protein